MKTAGPKSRSIEQVIEQQVHRWQLANREEAKKEKNIPVVTISREPGSGGNIIAGKLSEELGLDLFHQEIIHEMAESARVSTRLLETVDEKRMNMLDEWIASIVDRRHLWPDQYLKHLMRLVAAIGRHRRAILIGRGANFVLPPGGRLRVRVIAPRITRIENVAKTFGIPKIDAEKRITKTESDRRAFIQKYFNADIADPVNYDLILNTGTLGIDGAVSSIKGALEAMPTGDASTR